jgi:hypothetical protein
VNGEEYVLTKITPFEKHDVLLGFVPSDDEKIA